VAEAQRAPGDLVLMDRSVHTLLAHRHAIQSITGLALSEPAARVVAASCRAAWPDTVIFLDVPHPTILDRNRGKFPPGSIFIDAAYNRAFRQYFTTLADEPGARVVRLDATAKLEDLVAAAKAHIRYLLPVIG
jgi:thymidylate kinase